MSQNYAPVLIADYCCDTGEGPIWHPFEKRLYWTDIPTGRAFRYSPSSGEFEQFLHGRIVAGMTVQVDGTLLLFGEHGSIAHYSEDGIEDVVKEIATEVGTRFNDVAVDPLGRVFCGTMPSQSHPGRLYRLNLDGTLDMLIEGVGISNGIGFTTDGSKMFYAESLPGVIHVFDYDVSSGSPTNQRTFAAVPKEQGSPDGLTVDAENYVWSARWDGHCIVRYAPDGTIDRIFEFPVPKVSSLTFGGDDYGDLYATTAGGHQKDIDGPQAGALFVIKNVGQGKPDYLSQINLSKR